MELIWAVVVAIVVCAVGILGSAIARRLAPPRRPADLDVGVTIAGGAGRVAPLPLGPASSGRPGLPVAPAGLRLRRSDDLDALQLQAATTLLDRLPRPPRLLGALMSRDLINRASAAELAELVASEPLVASRVLLAVNSPLYGLTRPVSSIAQALTLLGMNTVRVICMRCMLQHGFRADDPERARLLAATWAAGALAGEIGDAALRRIGIADVGQGAGEVLLSFVGRLAVAAAVPRSALAVMPSHGFLERTQGEQDRLGLCAAEIGRLLMVRWGFPRELADHVAEIDRVLVTPRDPGSAGPDRVRQAFAYLCARLGERLAFAELSELARFDLASDADPALDCVRGDLDDPAFARLVEQLRSREVSARACAVLQHLQARMAPVAEPQAANAARLASGNAA